MRTERKMIDIDGLFETFFKKYLAENLGKKTEEEIENLIPELYETFGKTPNDKLDGKSPEEYFKAFGDDELIEALKESVRNGNDVSDFLCGEIEARGGLTDKLCELIVTCQSDELATYCVNMLGNDVSVEYLGKFLDLIADESTGESLTESLTELLRDNGDKVKDKIISVYSDNKKSSRKGNFVEIMSRMSPDDAIFGILCDELKNDEKNIPLNAAYVARYGDDRALPILEELIKKDGITYYDFKELKNAIEELGGECNVKFKK